MGGDFAPKSELLGAIEALKEKPDTLELILVGRKELLDSELKSLNYENVNLKIVNADEVISMTDAASDSFRNKPNSSISVALNLIKQEEADGVISAGNTGAFTANCILNLGRLPNVGRPTIGSLFPTHKGKTMLFDVGAFVDCRANHLYEFAVMGSLYMQYSYGIQKPRVALLSVGEEKTKGNEVTIEAYKLLEKSNLNFIGNMEGRDILSGDAEVIVCDGFTGNIILKFGESLSNVLKNQIIKFTKKGFFHKLWIGLFQNTLKSIMQDFDYQKYGGVPLLGVNGVCIVGHGKSTPLAIKNMIFRAEEVFSKKVNESIVKFLEKNK
jgi:phosphate acyltransferase